MHARHYPLGGAITFTEGTDVPRYFWEDSNTYVSIGWVLEHSPVAYAGLTAAMLVGDITLEPANAPDIRLGNRK